MCKPTKKVIFSLLNRYWSPILDGCYDENVFFYIINYGKKEHTVKVSHLYVYFYLQTSNFKNASFPLGDAIFFFLVDTV
jgi:hypothetical protein